MRVAALVVIACALSGCAIGGTKTTTVTATRTVTAPAGPKTPPAAEAETANVKYFGIPVSVAKLDARRYTIAIEPQFFLVGVTANVAHAASQQNACQPLECPPVEDDRLVIPAGKQNLLFILPAKTTGTVLTLGKHDLGQATITGTQLAALFNKTAQTPKLLESLDSGLWLTVNVDTVTRFAQQYEP